MSEPVSASSSRQHRVSSMAVVSSALRRGTIMLARDALLRRLSRQETRTSTPDTTSIMHVMKLVHDVNHQVAFYRGLVQMIGTSSDTLSLRADVSTTRKSCVKACDTIKNCVLPQLKTYEILVHFTKSKCKKFVYTEQKWCKLRESHEGVASSEFTTQSSQFIGCLGAFLTEMRRAKSMLTTLTYSPNQEATDPQELQAISQDIEETEKMMETLENLITVHFSTKDQEQTLPNPRSRHKGCFMGKLCSNFKTSYA